MKLISYMPMSEWLRALKNKRRSMLEFGEERLYGFVWKNFFYVTYSSGYEWNRKITNEKNRAIGFAKEIDGVTHLRFMHLRGYADPLTVLCVVFYIFLIFAFFPELALEAWLMGFFAVMILIFSGLEVSMSERGQAGEAVLWRILSDPRENYRIR